MTVRQLHIWLATISLLLAGNVVLLQEFQERIQKLVDRYEAQFLKKKERKVNL